MIFSVEKVIEGLFSRLFLAKKSALCVHKTCTFFTCVHVSVSGPFTVYENHRKSLIQHYCERSELRLHFEWTKVVQFGEFLKT